VLFSAAKARDAVSRRLPFFFISAAWSSRPVCGRFGVSAA